MSRGKSISQSAGRDLPDPRFIAGELHLPEISSVRGLELAAGSFDLERGEQLKALSIGVPVVAAEFADITSRTNKVDIHPEKIIEERRSAHRLGFGRLIGWLPHKGRSGSLLEVALKPFMDPEAALREFQEYRRLGHLGVETFQPVGVFPAKTGEHFIGITKKRQDLMSLDRDEWVVGRNVSTEEEAETAERNSQTVKDIAVGFAYIHAQGVFHPDGQIKNWAVTPTGKIGIIDTENMHAIPIDGREAGNDALEYAWNDIEKLVKSLVLDTKDEDAKMFGVGMFARLDLVHVRSGLEQLFITPYLETLLTMSDFTDSKVDKKHINDLFEGVANRFYDDKQWPQHYIDMQYVAFAPTSQTQES